MPENNEKFPSHFLKPKETSSNVFFLSDQLTKTLKYVYYHKGQRMITFIVSVDIV